MATKTRKASTAKTWKGPKPAGRGRKAGTRTSPQKTTLQGGDALAAVTTRKTPRTAQGAATAPAAGGFARITVEVPDGDALAMARKIARGAGKAVELLREGSGQPDVVDVPTGRQRSQTEPTGKVAAVFALARRPEGANRGDFADATGWANGPWPNLLAKLADRYGYQLDIDKSATPATYRLLEAGATPPARVAKVKATKPAKATKAKAEAEDGFGKLIEGGNANPVKPHRKRRLEAAIHARVKAAAPAATPARAKVVRKVAATKARRRA
jgi:hypothetical protein